MKAREELRSLQQELRGFNNQASGISDVAQLPRTPPYPKQQKLRSKLTSIPGDTSRPMASILQTFCTTQVQQHHRPKEIPNELWSHNSLGWGDDFILAKLFVIVCEGTTLNWFSKLPPNSISSAGNTWNPNFWLTFRGFNKAFVTLGDLFNCKHGEDTLTNYFRRFIQLKAQIADVPDSVTIDAYLWVLGPWPCPHHFTKESLSTIHELY